MLDICEIDVNKDIYFQGKNGRWSKFCVYEAENSVFRYKIF